MIWIFLDGTTFEIGGVVRGDSALARVLRRDVELCKLGQPTSVVLLAPAMQELDLDSAEHVDAWLRDKARLAGTELAAAPSFTRAEPPDDDDRGAAQDVEH